ncbi:MAG: nucleotidyltransferase domain-containing protein [Chitinivibrionales bacterium]|nr:nucleotidyltransferase domain-containing protein [Chitinivibrionales bacterium]
MNPAEFGLRQDDLRRIDEVVRAHGEIERARIFGFRALGNFKPGSDCDIALFGESVTPETVRLVSSRLNEELPLPNMFDIVDATHTTNHRLLEHISQYWREIFCRSCGDGDK